MVFTCGNFTRTAHNIYPWYQFGNYQFKISTTSPRVQWVNPFHITGLLCGKAFCSAAFISIGSGQWHLAVPFCAPKPLQWNHFSAMSSQIISNLTFFFVKQLVQDNSKVNTKVCNTGPLCRESTVTSGFPTQRANNAEIISILSWHYAPVWQNSSPVGTPFANMD